MWEAALRGAGLALAVWRVMGLLSDLAAGSRAGQPWGSAQRLGLWTMLAPVLINSCGLAASWLLEEQGSDSKQKLINQVLAGMLALCLTVRHAVADGGVAVICVYDVVVVALPLAAWLAGRGSHRAGGHQKARTEAGPKPIIPAQQAKLQPHQQPRSSQQGAHPDSRKGKEKQDEGQDGLDWLISTQVAMAGVPDSPRGQAGRRLLRTTSNPNSSSQEQRGRRLMRTSSKGQGQRRGAGLVDRFRSSSPDDLLFSVDGSGGEASRVRADQIWVNDILQLLLGLPVALLQGGQLVVMSCQPATPLGPLARPVALVASLVFMGGCPLMLWRTICYPRLALTTRDRWTPVYLALMPFAHQLALQLLNQPSPFSLRVGIMLLAAGLGLMGISAKAFSAWLPVTMTMFYSIHAWRHWDELAWGLRLWVAVEYNLLPVASYLVVKAVSGRLQHWALGGMAALFSRLATGMAASHQRAWRVAAAVVVQQLVGTVLLGMLFTYSSEWADNSSVLAPLASLLDMAVVIRLLPAAGVAGCGMVVPLIQLLRVGVPTRAWQRQLKGRNTIGTVYPLLTRALAAATAPILLRQAASIWTAAAGATNAAALPAKTAGMVAAAVQVAASAAPFLCSLQQDARKTLQWHLAWLCAVGLVPCASQVAGAALGLACHPLLRLVLSSTWLAAVRLSGPVFAAGLPLLAFFSFGAHVMTHHTAPPAWGQLGLDAVEYGAAPVVAYWGVTWTLRGLETAESYMVRASRRTNGQGSAASHPAGAIRAIMHIGLCIVQLWVAAAGPLPLPSEWSSSYISAPVKAGLLAASHHLAYGSSRYMQAVRTAGAVAVAAACFLAVAALQAAILASPAFAAPRQRWYEGAKGRVMALGEMTLRRCVGLGQVAEQEALRQQLLESMRIVTEGSFPGCTMQLVVLGQQQDASFLTPVVRYTVATSQETAGMPQQEELLLGDMPGVEVACKTGLALWKAGLSPGLTGYADWEALCSEYGLDSFLVVPLACSGQVQGALLLACMSPVSLDRHQRRLAGDLAGVTGQVLYTLACISKMHDTELLIQDALPQQVAERLMQRAVEEGLAPAPSSIAPSRFPTMRRRAGQQKEPVAEGAVAYQQWHPSVSVLFADIVDFPALIAGCKPEQVMELLHELFTKYDRLCRQHGVYKVETVGDCYMACTGVVTENPDHAARMLTFAQDMLETATGMGWPLGGCVRVRIGVHSGRVMSGVVGSIRARYCLFGDTVNTASRMQSTGVVDHIQVSAATYELLEPQQQSCFEPREGVAVKGKGVMHTWLLGPATAQEQS